MSILITGGYGFLGTHLRNKLDEGHDTEVMTLSSDIREPLTGLKMTEIYNLAGTPSSAWYLKDPIGTLETNTTGMINVLNLALKNKAKVLQASIGEMEEGFSHLGNRACYYYGKMIAETLCFDYYRKHGLEVRILRMYNSYGPGMKLDDGRVIPEFIKRALSGEDLIVYGGRQTRSFCYVSDMIDGMIKMMNGVDLGPINICHPEEIAIAELAELIIKECDSKSKIIYKPRKEGDQDKINPVVDLAQDWLGWEPKVSLIDGLRLTIKDFKRRLLWQ